MQNEIYGWSKHRSSVQNSAFVSFTVPRDLRRGTSPFQLQLDVTGVFMNRSCLHQII